MKHILAILMMIIMGNPSLAAFAPESDPPSQVTRKPASPSVYIRKYKNRTEHCEAMQEQVTRYELLLEKNGSKTFAAFKEAHARAQVTDETPELTAAIQAMMKAGTDEVIFVTLLIKVRECQKEGVLP